MQRIVVDAEQIEGDRLRLTPEQQHYLQRVLRLRSGDRFFALNGQGHLWFATLTTATTAQLSEAQTPADAAVRPRPHITLAASLPKQGFDEVVRQVTELGVDAIVPIISDRTVLRPSPNKLKRWQKIAAEAGEQSERLLVPNISDPVAWSTWITRESQSVRYLCVARQRIPHLLTYAIAACPDEIEIAVGPEGGWTESEIAAAIAHGYHPVNLGPFILRAVTAAVTALALLQGGNDFATINQPITI